MINDDLRGMAELPPRVFTRAPMIRNNTAGAQAWQQ